MPLTRSFSAWCITPRAKEKQGEKHGTRRAKSRKLAKLVISHPSPLPDAPEIGMARSLRPPLVRSSASLTLLSSALDIFSRRPKESYIEEEEPPFPVNTVTLDLSRAYSYRQRRLLQMPSLTSLSSYIIRRTSSSHSSSSPELSSVHDVPPTLFLSPHSAYAFSPSTPVLVSPATSAFSDASSVLLPTPTSSEFPPLSTMEMAGGRMSSEEEERWEDCIEVQEEKGEMDGVKSPVLYEGAWGHGCVGLAF